MEKVLQELFWAYFFGRPYRSNGTKIHLDAALHITDLSSTLRSQTSIKNNQLSDKNPLSTKMNNKTTA